MPRANRRSRLAVPDPGYLHPKALKDKYPSLSQTRLAILFGRSVRSIERYVASRNDDNDPDVPESILVHAWLLDFYLSHYTQ